MIMIQPWFLSHLEFVGTLEVRKDPPVGLPLVSMPKLGSIRGKTPKIRIQETLRPISMTRILDPREEN